MQDYVVLQLLFSYTLISLMRWLFTFDLMYLMTESNLQEDKCCGFLKPYFSQLPLISYMRLIKKGNSRNVS